MSLHISQQQQHPVSDQQHRRHLPMSTLHQSSRSRSRSSSSCGGASYNISIIISRSSLRQQMLVSTITLMTLLFVTTSSNVYQPPLFVTASNEPSVSYQSLLLSSSKSSQQYQQLQLPVIGILSQPSKKHDHSYHYIATSYVDWIEGGNGRDRDQNNHAKAITLPIPYDASPELLDELFTQINGLLLPGGWNGYMPPSVPYLLDKIVESNTNGIYFPVWGTCLGYEFLIKYVGGVDAIQTGFDLYNSSIPLESVQVQELYNDPNMYETVTNFPVTLNNHQLGIEPDHFLSNERLTSVWDITSINYDVNDRPFVSSIEPRDPMKFPFYGVQYHPEKNAYEYTTYPNTNHIPYENIDHTEEGIEFSYYVSNFFLQKVLYGQSIQGRRHWYTQTNRFPPIRSYVTSIGIKYEDIYIIPYASHWMTTPTTTSSGCVLQQQGSNNETIHHHQQQQQQQQQQQNRQQHLNNNHTATINSPVIINVSRTGNIDISTTIHEQVVNHNYVTATTTTATNSDENAILLNKEIDTIVSHGSTGTGTGTGTGRSQLLLSTTITHLPA